MVGLRWSLAPGSEKGGLFVVGSNPQFDFLSDGRDYYMGVNRAHWYIYERWSRYFSITLTEDPRKTARFYFQTSINCAAWDKLRFDIASGVSRQLDILRKSWTVVQ